MAIDSDALFAAARTVQSHAHARYSNYYVGAAILDEAGNIHVGCNVENASFPETSCAEATAIGAMVSSGARKIVAIAIVGGMGDNANSALFESAGDLGACTPCGGCRQRILPREDALPGVDPAHFRIFSNHVVPNRIVEPEIGVDRVPLNILFQRNGTELSGASVEAVGNRVCSVKVLRLVLVVLKE